MLPLQIIIYILPLATVSASVLPRNLTQDKNVVYNASDETELLLNRELLMYRDEKFSPWSEWGDCSLADCTEMRFRTCKNESIRAKPANNLDTDGCPVKYIVEKRRCTDDTQCTADGK